MLGNAYGMKSDIMLAKGDRAEAAEAARRAIAIQEPVFPADHPALLNNRRRLEQASRPAELLAEGGAVVEGD
jgi:hypothetical protein